MKILSYSMLIIMFCLFTAQATVHRVPNDFPDIQTAINNANPSDTVLVASGIYNEKITINVNLVLISEAGPEVTIINSTGTGGGQQSYVIFTGISCVIKGFQLLSDDPFTFGISTFGTDSTMIIANNIIRGMSYSAIGLIQSSPLIHNNLLIENIQTGIIMNTNSKPKIINNTIANNRSGIAAFVNSEPEIINNIIVNHTQSGILSESGSSTQNTYNDVWNNFLNYSGNSAPGIGDITMDPLFNAEHELDFTLLPGSPCIDAGDPNSPPDPDGTIADMGAYYFDQNPAGIFNREIIPQKVKLFQNYPNPFNPVTTITYTIPKKEHIQLTIYNLLGQEIVRLVDNQQAPGEHQVQWNGSNSEGHPVASGVYLYHIRSANFVETKKMMLIR